MLVATTNLFHLIEPNLIDYLSQIQLVSIVLNFIKNHREGYVYIFQSEFTIQFPHIMVFWCLHKSSHEYEVKEHSVSLPRCQ